MLRRRRFLGLDDASVSAVNDCEDPAVCSRTNGPVALSITRATGEFVACRNANHAVAAPLTALTRWGICGLMRRTEPSAPDGVIIRDSGGRPPGVQKN